MVKRVVLLADYPGQVDEVDHELVLHLSGGLTNQTLVRPSQLVVLAPGLLLLPPWRGEEGRGGRAPGGGGGWQGGDGGGGGEGRGRGGVRGGGRGPGGGRGGGGLPTAADTKVSRQLHLNLGKNNSC